MSYSTIPYPNRKIMNQETLTRQPFIGFISPDGIVIDFTSYGKKKHDDLGNPISNYFLKYISYVNGDDIHKQDFLSDIKPETKLMKLVEGYDELVYRGWFDGDEAFSSFNDILSSLRHDIKRYKNRNMSNDNGELSFLLAELYFFKDAYKDKDFFRTIGKVIRIPSREYIKNELRKKYDVDSLPRSIDRLINEEIIKYLMSYFKDICVLYLGFDSVETFQSNGEAIIIKNRERYFEESLVTPRIITTTRYNPNEVYFNCLIMDWVVHKLPRYTKGENGLYTPQSELFNYYETSREQEFKEEIEKIKKLVPLKDRFKYFIKP